MKWSMFWRPEAEQALAGLWINSPNRNEITAAAQEIDNRLKTDPENEGESRSDNNRVLFVPPLAVSFRVYQSRHSVHVIGVWLIRRNPRST